MDRRNKSRALVAPLVFFAVLLGAQSAFAQKPLKAIKVTVGAKDADASAGRELLAGVGLALREYRDVASGEKNPDIEIHLASAPVAPATGCRGFAVSVVIIRRSDSRFDQSVYVGPDLKRIARFVVDNVNEEYFAPIRARAEKKER